MPPPIAVAVTQIILHHVQATLPQWASVSGETVNLNRKEYKRHKDARLTFKYASVYTSGQLSPRPDHWCHLFVLRECWFRSIPSN